MAAWESLEVNVKFPITRESATPAQLSELAEAVDRLDTDCQLALDLVRTMFGTEDERSNRAEELCNSLQRFRWSLDRGGSQSSFSSTYPSTRRAKAQGGMRRLEDLRAR